MKYADLPNVPAPGIFLSCDCCCGEFSACRGDYFWAPSDAEPTCGACDEPLVLMRKRTIYELVTPAEAIKP